MGNRVRAAADRINKAVSIVQVLDAYGYDVRTDAGHREQQFRCDLHGSGHDDTPSARVYPDSNSWYCFGCSLTRDAIETVQVKEGIGFWAAVKKLERAYGLAPLPLDYGVDEVGHEALSAVRSILETHKTFADEETRLRSLLDGITRDRDMPLDSLLSFWEAFDKVVYMVRGPRGDGGIWSEQKGQMMLVGLRCKVLEATTR